MIAFHLILIYRVIPILRLSPASMPTSGSRGMPSTLRMWVVPMEPTSTTLPSLWVIAIVYDRAIALAWVREIRLHFYFNWLEGVRLGGRDVPVFQALKISANISESNVG
jgi:hypothetical protein